MLTEVGDFISKLRHLGRWKIFSMKHFCYLLKCIDRIPWQTIKPSGGMMCQGVRKEIQMKGVIAIDGNVYRDNIQEFVSQAFAVNYNQGNTSYRPLMMSNQIQPPGFPPVPNNQNVQLNQTYQAPAYQAPAPQTQGVSKEDFSTSVKANEAVMKNMQTQGQNMQNLLTNLTDLITKFVNYNAASTSSSGTLPSNMIANPQSNLKAITTRSGVSYDGPKATKDTVNPTNNRNTEDVQLQAVQSESPVLTSKPVTS
nr:reverse transcriptase domain-containing protein [Tanacetum cinerariifolium]